MADENQNNNKHAVLSANSSATQLTQRYAKVRITSGASGNGKQQNCGSAGKP